MEVPAGVRYKSWIDSRMESGPFAARGNSSELICMFTAVLALVVGAQIAIPFQPVPFTLQTLAVLLCAYLLGPLRALIACLIYLALGVSGIPVFSGWSSSPGLAFFQMRSGGFILGFIPAAFITGYFATGRTVPGFWRLSLIGLLGHAVLVMIGMLWLARFIGLEAAFNFGVLPFIPGAILKSVIAAGFFLALDSLWKTAPPKSVT